MDNDEKIRELEKRKLEYLSSEKACSEMNDEQLATAQNYDDLGSP